MTKQKEEMAVLVRPVNNITKADIVVALVVLIIAFVSYFCVGMALASGEAETVVIELDGEIYAKYQLNSIFGKKAVEIDTVFGYNIVEIECDSVAVVDASCKDKVCVGKISKAGEMLVCLPNRLVVRLLGEAEVDAVTY